MKLTLLPLRVDDLIRVRCGGAPDVPEPGRGCRPRRDLSAGPYAYGRSVVLDFKPVAAASTPAACAGCCRRTSAAGQAGGRLVLSPRAADHQPHARGLRRAGQLQLATDEEEACLMARAATTFPVQGN